jgi:hypothetical protein
VENGTFYLLFLTILFGIILKIGLREAAHSERSGEWNILFVIFNNTFWDNSKNWS